MSMLRPLFRVQLTKGSRYPVFKDVEAMVLRCKEIVENGDMFAGGSSDLETITTSSGVNHPSGHSPPYGT